jgi:hypothetical protein
MLSILTVKTESLYCACSPELDIVSYGGCRDEALNNLQDEIRLNQSAPAETRPTLFPSLNRRNHEN